MIGESRVDRQADDGRFPFPAYPNGWFRVAYSSELERGAVKPLHYFGRELALFRTEEGVAHVLDAHCPHMGAHLGVGGRVEGSGIRCPFHEWLWSGDGDCLEIPYAKRIPPKAQMRSWPVAEKNGLILVHHHAERKPPSYEIPELAQLASDAWRKPHVEHWRLHSRWLDMNENCIDRAHFVYVHGTLTMPTIQTKADGPVFRTESRMDLKAPGGQGAGCLVTKDHGPGFQTVEISGIIDTLLMNTCTPIDEEETDVSFLYTVRTEGDERKEHLAQKVVADLVQQFERDVPIWQNKAYWSRPVLCDGDGPLSDYRSWMQQFF